MTKNVTKLVSLSAPKFDVKTEDKQPLKVETKTSSKQPISDQHVPTKNLNIAAAKSTKMISTPVKSNDLKYEDIKANAPSTNRLSSFQNLNSPSLSQQSSQQQIAKPTAPLFAAAKKAQLSAQTLQSVFDSFQNPPPTAKVFKVTIDPKSYKYDSNKYYKNYMEESRRPKRIVKTTPLADGKVQRIYDNNASEMIMPTGARRETFPNGYSIVHFVNGDIKQTLPDGSQIYYHSEPNITHISLPEDKGQVSLQDLQIQRHTSRISL